VGQSPSPSPEPAAPPTVPANDEDPVIILRLHKKQKTMGSIFGRRVGDLKAQGNNMKPPHTSYATRFNDVAR